MTLEDGLHTGDVFQDGLSKKRVGTVEFADAVIERLGRKPATLKSVEMKSGTDLKFVYHRPVVKRELCGVDFFVCDADTTADALAAKLDKATDGVIKLKLITNRGVKVWPEGFPETFCTDHWRCRFVGPSIDIHDPRATYTPIEPTRIVEALRRAGEAGIEVVKTENLYLFDGVRGFSLGQGE